MAKSANLLVDGLGGPSRVGLLLPLHWQSVALLLAVVATGATAVVAASAEELEGCEAAFVLAPHAAAALDAGVDEVLALSGHPLGAPAGPLPAMVQDYAREVPSYGDHFSGPAPGPAQVVLGAAPFAVPAPQPGAQPGRLLTVLPLTDPAGLAAVLAALGAGGSLVLAAGEGLDLAAVARTERVTAAAGTDLDLG